MQLLQFVIMASVISYMRFRTADASTPVCAESAWKIQGDRCYRYLPYTGQNYQYANFASACLKLGGELARIDNAKQNAFVASIVPQVGEAGEGKRQAVMIGLNDVNTEGEFKWADGTTPAYVNWDNGQPDNSEVSNRKDGEDCVVLRTDNGKWNDMHCGSFYSQSDLAEYNWTWWDDTTHFICSADVISTNYKAEGQGWCGTLDNRGLPSLVTETNAQYLTLKQLCDGYKECVGFEQGAKSYLKFSSAQSVPAPPTGWSKELGRESGWCQSNCTIEKVFPAMEIKCWTKTHAAMTISTTTTTNPPTTTITTTSSTATTTTTTTPTTTTTTTPTTTTTTTPTTIKTTKKTAQPETTKTIFRPLPSTTSNLTTTAKQRASSGSFATIRVIAIAAMTTLMI